MLKVYAIAGSPLLFSSAGRTFLLLEELGLEYEPVFLDFRKGEHKSEAYLKLNPNGKVPTFIDEEENFTLWESSAINNYLCEKYKSDLAGTSIKDRANINKWNYWTIVEYQTPVVQLMVQLKFVPEDKRDLKHIETLKEKIYKLSKVLDNELEGKEFLNGDKISLADINIAPNISMVGMFGVDTSDLKNFSRWVKSIISRETFKKISK